MQNASASYKTVTPYIPCGEFSTKRNVVPCKLRGFAASPGIVEGPCTIIRNLQDLHKVKDGAILVCEVPSPKLAPYMPFLKGLVAKQGGPLCIASGYAREYKIPAVVGIEGIMNAIQNGDVVRIDGASGTVDIVG
jgi:pyruvate, water dikinase